MLVSNVYQIDSVIYTYVCVYIYFFQVLFYYRLFHDTEYSSLHYMVGLRCLFIFYVVVCSCQTHNLSLPFDNHTFVVYVCQPISFIEINSFVPFFF